MSKFRTRFGAGSLRHGGAFWDEISDRGLMEQGQD
jgi:hypothetical protein